MDSFPAAKGRNCFIGQLASNALPERHLAKFDRIRGRPRILGRDVLALDADLMMQGQDDRADHGGQQHQSRA